MSCAHSVMKMLKLLCHLFCQCKHVKPFWERIERLLLDNSIIYHGNKDLSNYMSLLGFEDVGLPI